MNRNTLTLFAVWAAIILFWGVLLYGFGRGALHGNYSGVCCLVLVLVMVVGIRWWTRGRMARLLKTSATAEPLIAFYRRTFNTRIPVPTYDALCAQACALAHLFYADYPAARADLASIDWTGRMPLIRAAPLGVEALLCYFDTHDYERGLALVREAVQLSQIAGVVPGAKTSAAAFQSYLEIGEILCNRGTPEILASLQGKLKLLPLLGQVLVAWGLAIGYQKAGDEARAESFRAYLRETAPHCRAFSFDLP